MERVQEITVLVVVNANLTLFAQDQLLSQATLNTALRPVRFLLAVRWKIPSTTIFVFLKQYACVTGIGQLFFEEECIVNLLRAGQTSPDLSQNRVIAPFYVLSTVS